MPSFRYRAFGGGELVQGTVEGADRAEIVAGLQKRGLMVLAVAPAAPGFGLLSLELGGNALRRGELVEVTREFAVMLGAGQDVDRALRFMVEGATNKRVAAVLGRVRDAVRDGSALAAALAREPKSFPRLYIGLVRAGEAGGELAGTMARLTELLERQRDLNATVGSAMIYPGILMVAALGSIVLLLTQVLPQFVPLFVENGVALPASTAFLLGAGRAVSTYGPLALAALVAAVIGARYGLRRPGFRRAADLFLLRLPVAGGVLREVLAARFARTLGMLLSNGVPLLAALGIAGGVLGNRVAAEAVATAAESVKSGQGLAGPLGRLGVFPARLVHLLRLGEDTAELGPMALRAAAIHEDRTRLAVQRLTALLVPAITVLMGAAVAGIVSSLMLAMLSLNDIAK